MRLTLENLIRASLFKNPCKHGGILFKPVIDKRGYIKGIKSVLPLPHCVVMQK